MLGKENAFEAEIDARAGEYPFRAEFEELRHADVGQARQWLGQQGAELDEILALQTAVRTTPGAAELGRQEAGGGRTAAIAIRRCQVEATQ